MPENKLHTTSLRTAGAGLYGDGGGLYLKKQSISVGQWHYRYSFSGVRVEMGLGGWPGVSLKQARELRNDYRSILKTTQKDPRAERDRRKRSEEIARGSTLEQITDEKFEAVKEGLRREKDVKGWRAALDKHLLPKLGHVPIQELTQHDIAGALKPIWRTKAVTARKITNRLGLIFDYAEAKGLPVSRQTVRAAKNLLGDQGHVSKHVPALSWKSVPEFYASLGESPTELALRLLILTALRSSPVRHANLTQIEGDIWTVPAEYVKGTKGNVADFLVPLSDEALKVIELATPFERDGWLFPGSKRSVVSDMTLSQYMKRRGMKARPHGFRSSFRTWAAEATNAPREVAEAALGHSVGSAVEQAYQRGAMLARRRRLMENWSWFITEKPGQILELKNA